MSRRSVRIVIAVALFIIGTAVQGAVCQDFQIPPDETPRQFDDPQGAAALVQTSEFIRVEEARQQYQVDGTGLTVAVLDTGINRLHVDFDGKIAAEKNFTTDNGGNENDAADGNGHGTNVGGIVVADGDHRGIALGGRILPIKALSNAGGGTWTSLIKALTWIDSNHVTHHISVVNLSLGDGQNYETLTLTGERKQIEDLILALRAKNIPVVISAGNDFFPHQSKQGMSFPAICRGTVSVGAVYDANVGAFSYVSGAKAHSTAAGRITPFSQRLHPSLQAATATDVFAPGAPLTSAGLTGAHGESIQHGTSQAAPVVTGVIMLLQEYHRRVAGSMPTVDQLESWLRTGVEINDGDDEDDNVTHTGLNFVRLDAMLALGAADGELRGQLFREGSLK